MLDEGSVQRSFDPQEQMMENVCIILFLDSTLPKYLLYSDVGMWVFLRRQEEKNQAWSWRYVVQEKTTHLAQYLLGKREELDFIEPNKPLQ